MPLYEYRCPKCKCKFELRRKEEDKYSEVKCVCGEELNGKNSIVISLSHFSFPGGLPSYDNEVHVDEGDEV